jgi:hypothetical protein
MQQDIVGLALQGKLSVQRITIITSSIFNLLKTWDGMDNGVINQLDELKKEYLNEVIKLKKVLVMIGNDKEKRIVLPSDGLLQQREFLRNVCYLFHCCVVFLVLTCNVV